MGMHKKSFSVDVDDGVSDAFSSQVADRGYTKYRAVEGALRAFIAMPPEAQVAFMSDAENAQKILLNAFREMGLQTDTVKSPKPTESSVEECIENIKQFVKIKLPSPEEQRMISALRKALGPEPRKRKRG